MRSPRRAILVALALPVLAPGATEWEWGVTLFARDPLEFKKLVTDMRFDHASAVYAEFGDFSVGKVVGSGEWLGILG